MPPKPKAKSALQPLVGLDMTNKDTKIAYRQFTTWLRKHGIPLSAIEVHRSLGSRDSEDPHLEDVTKNIRCLETILPVYVEALLCLCGTEMTNTSGNGWSGTPLEWWSAFKTHRLKEAWFANIHPRIPTDIMDLRNYDEDYYKMDDKPWAKSAAIYILKMDFQMDTLMLILARNQKEYDMMKEDIDVDDAEMGRREAVITRVAHHRLTCDDEGYSQGVSENEIKGLFEDAQADTEYMLTVTDHRIQEKVATESTTIEDNDYNMEAILQVLKNHQRVLTSLRNEVEVLRTGHFLLKRDLRTHFKRTGSVQRLQARQDNEPAWWSQCDSEVYELKKTDGMKFESKGVTETDHQKKGRKQRDEIYDRLIP
jgi:hypothetical protein